MNRNHAPSLVGLAECYLLQGVTYGSLPRGKATLLARDAIERALALDGDHAAAISADAQLRFYLEWDGDGAEKAFQRALELNPNADSVRQHYAMFLVARDRLDAALSQVQSAVALDPASHRGARGARHGVVLHRQPAAGGAGLPRSAGHRRQLLAGPQRAGASPAGRQAVRQGARACSMAGRRARPIRRIASSSRRAASRWRGRGSCSRPAGSPTNCCRRERRRGSGRRVRAGRARRGSQALTLLAAGGPAAVGAHALPAPRRAVRRRCGRTPASRSCSTAWTSSADPAAPVYRPGFSDRGSHGEKEAGFEDPSLADPQRRPSR